LVLFLIGLTAVVSFLETGLDGIFEGYQRYDLINAVDIVFSVLAALATVAVLAAGYGLVSLAIIALLDTMLRVVSKMIVAARVFPVEAQPRLGFDRASWRSIKSYSLWNSLNDFVTEGTAQFDRILIPLLLTSALVTPYSLVVALAAAIFLLAEPITDTFLPIASARHNTNDRLGLTAFLLRGTRLVTLMTLPVAVIVVFFGEAILDLWVGSEYTDVSVTVLWFTAANFFFSTYLWTSLNVLMGAGEIKRIFWISVAEVVLVLALIVSLVPVMGLPGLALAGLIANVVTGVFLFIPAACQKTTFQPFEFLTKSLPPLLLAVLPGVITAWSLSNRLDLSSWASTALAVAATGSVSMASLLIFGTTRREKLRYFVVFRRITGLA
jgi:O-antigen/teichoic acid export membrane protein